MSKLYLEIFDPKRKKIFKKLSSFKKERLFEPVRTSSLSLSVVEDIVADKAYTIGRRGQWRDYVDIFFLLKAERFKF